MTQKPDCVFCRIARGEVQVHIVCETDDLVVFCDRNPIRRGHLQILPRMHIETFDLLPEALANAILAMGQSLARVQKRLYGVERVAFLFTGGDVNHAHAHLVPMHDKTDITSTRYIATPDLTFADPPFASDATLRDTATELSEALSAAMSDAVIGQDRVPS
ncbi:MAG: HIT family protein [Pseudomonadota bacterium]